MKVQNFILTEKLGKGSFGEVYLTKKIGSTRLYATKRVLKHIALRKEVYKYFNNEIFILKHVNHPNIIKFYEIQQTLNNFYLVFEHCNGGSLDDCLIEYKEKNQGKPFPEEIVQSIMRKVCSGLKYLHGNKILHRDLKSANIMVNFSSEEDKKNLNLLKADIKIIDFGFSRYLNENELAKTALGTIENMDPQLIEKLTEKSRIKIENFGYDKKADMWSLGTIAYQLLIGVTPFTGKNSVEFAENVKKGLYSIPNSLQLSKQSISFLNGLLQNDPKQRITADEAILHDFINMDVSKFIRVNLKKLAITKDFVLSTKNSNHDLWFLFESPGLEEGDPSEICGNKFTNPIINISSPNDKKNIDNSIIQGKKKEDYLGSLINGVTDLVFHTHQDLNQYQTELTEKTDKEKVDSNVDVYNLLQQTFDYINRDFYSFEPMLVPLCPSTTNTMINN